MRLCGSDVPEKARTFEGVPASARDARRFTTSTLRSWGCSTVVEAGAAIVAELAANAILHAGTKFTVSICRGDSTIRIAVTDESAREPRMNTAPHPHDTGGRGLFLVDAISQDWGIEHPAGHGKMVWAELAS